MTADSTFKQARRSFMLRAGVGLGPSHSPNCSAWTREPRRKPPPDAARRPAAPHLRLAPSA